MNKLKLYLIALAIPVCFFAQPYGQTFYSNSSTMTSASRMKIHGDGFLMAGTKNSSTFHIDRTTNGPLFTGGSFAPAEHDYTMYMTQGCFSSNSQITTFVGASVIEFNETYGRTFVATGAWEEGFFLWFLALDGGSVSNTAFKFPYTSSNISKPYIVQSQSASKDFFVCGQFDTSIYVIRIDTNGTQVWSHLYHCGNPGNINPGPIFEPKAIIESDFNQQVLVTGRVITTFTSTARADEGFILNLDPGAGGINWFSWYGNITGCQWFNDIKNAHSPFLGNGGYVLAGTTDALQNTPGEAWLTTVDLSGNIIWSNSFTSSTDPTYSWGLNSVVERRNQNSGHYEYYALGSVGYGGDEGQIVYKIHEDGKPLHISSPSSRDEFYYSTGQGIAYSPVAITYTDMTGVDDGIQLMSTYNGNHHLVESYFNGISGCNDNQQNIYAYDTDFDRKTPWIAIGAGPTQCNSFYGYDPWLATTLSQPCSAASVGGGSNLRTVGIPIRNSNTAFSLSPNPSNGTLQISTTDRITLHIANELGQHVKTIQLDQSGAIDLTDLKAGIYFMTGKNENGSVNQKLIITK